MGGNALKTIDIESKRLNKEEFNNITKKTVRVLNNIASELNIKINSPHEVLAYKSKETFGDLDLLIDKELLNYVTYEDILNRLGKEFNFKGLLPFKPKEEKDMVFSFGLPSDEKNVFFQVDLISSEKEYFDFHSKYLNWNDLGNLIGVVASSNGFLKYGHDGLKFQFRDGTNLFKEHVLTTDWDKALLFFGYDKETYYKGFDKIEDIYRYASSSRFFDKELYAFENRNHTQRTRDKKRPTYNGFLNWIENRNFSSKNLNANEWKERVYKIFPEFKEVEASIWNEYNTRKEIKKYFNGSELIKYKPELEKEAISIYLKELKNLVNDFEDFVLFNKENTIKALIDIKENKKNRLKIKP